MIMIHGQVGSINMIVYFFLTMGKELQIQITMLTMLNDRFAMVNDRLRSYQPDRVVLFVMMGKELQI